jgi:hypothetical protein
MAWFALVALPGTSASQGAPPPDGHPAAGSVPAELRAQLEKVFDAKALPTPTDLAKEIEQATELGHSIYLQDWASAVGTDIAAEKLNGVNDKVGGYLTVLEADEAGGERAFRVWFFSQEDPPRLAYSVRIPFERSAERTFETISPPRSPEPSLAVLYRARQAALAAVMPLVQPPNPVVVPAAALGEEGILVEVIAGTVRSKSAVIGKHYRVIVSEDGSRVTKVFPLSKTVMEMPVPTCPGEEKCAMVVSHIVTDAPVETHVFNSLLHHVDIYVSTARGWWRVKGTTIEFLGPLDVKK